MMQPLFPNKSSRLINWYGLTLSLSKPKRGTAMSTSRRIKISVDVN
jgi:hypothetical protein